MTWVPRCRGGRAEGDRCREVLIMVQHRAGLSGADNGGLLPTATYTPSHRGYIWGSLRGPGQPRVLTAEYRRKIQHNKYRIASWSSGRRFQTQSESAEMKPENEKQILKETLDSKGC